MINLVRLAHNELLLDPFECIVIDWLGHPDPAALPSLDENLKEWIQSIPKDVLRYWKITQRWPQLNLDKEVITQVIDGRAMLMNRFRDRVIYIESGCLFEGESLYILMGHHMVNYDSSEYIGRELEVSIPHFLVSHGLNAIIQNAHETISFDRELISPTFEKGFKSQSFVIWEDPEERKNIYYHNKGIIWSYFYSNSIVAGVKDQQAADWLNAKK